MQEAYFFHFEGVFTQKKKRKKNQYFEIESIINEAFELDIYMDLTWRLEPNTFPTELMTIKSDTMWKIERFHFVSFSKQQQHGQLENERNGSFEPVSHIRIRIATTPRDKDTSDSE